MGRRQKWARPRTFGELPKSPGQQVGRPGLDPGTLGLKVLVKTFCGVLLFVARCRKTADGERNSTIWLTQAGTG